MQNNNEEVSHKIHILVIIYSFWKRPWQQKSSPSLRDYYWQWKQIQKTRAKSQLRKKGEEFRR